jgi:hypothetical protein
MKELAEKVLKIVDCGLVRGLGEPEPGQMCVEAAVCKAMDEPHSDRPSCVADSVAEFKARLNDCFWQSEQSRAAGLREIAVCQLGSRGFDEDQFCRTVIKRVFAEVIPSLVRQRSTEPEVHAICDRMATASIEEWPTLVDELSVFLPLERMIHARNGRDGMAWPSRVSLSSMVKYTVERIAQGELGTSAYEVVAITDFITIFDKQDADIMWYVDDEAPLVQIARIGCDALREQNVPGVQAWDELQG